MSNLDNIKKNYNIFNTFRSTGFIVPVLYLYLESKIGIDVEHIIKIAGVYILLPFFIEIPLGYLGDTFGNKKIIQLGLIAQILSCLSLLFIEGNLAYHIYLITIYLAGASYSGADKALITPYFTKSKDFKNFLIKINGQLYKNSIIFLLIGTASWQINVKLPLIIQCFAFIISLVSISRISEPLKEIQEKSKPFKDFKIITQFLTENPSYLCLAFLMSVFSTSIALNHKTIQMLLNTSLDSYISQGNIWYIGISYALGNLISYKGSVIFLKSNIKEKSLAVQITMIAVLAVVSFIFMTLVNPIFVFIGFMLLNIFKALFRPIIGAELSIRFPLQRLRASALSFVSIIGAIVSAVVHFFLASSFQGSNIGNFIIITLICFASLFSIYFIQKCPKTQLDLGTMKLTGKKNILIQDQEQRKFKQVYSQEVSRTHFNNLMIFNKSNLYPHPMRGVCLIENSLTCDYIEGSELKESNEQYKLITLLLNERKESELFGFKSPSPSIKEIFKELKDNNLLSKLSDNKYWGNIHGDLHPANILIDEKKAIVIDWDMAGEGYIWFDYLTLITHPWLKISKAERLELFIKKFSDFTKKESLQLFEYFRQFKAAQLSNFINQDASMKGLVSLYKLPLGEVI